jgi:hypothetical protein
MNRMTEMPGKRLRSASVNSVGRSTMPWMSSEYCCGSMAGTPA